jgi:hypothetical protein
LSVDLGDVGAPRVLIALAAWPPSGVEKRAGDKGLAA